MMLSLCTIVKNEETSLPNCLSSVKDAVDEMVVLDTGSTDRTPEIAKQFGASVYHFEWCDDFAAARNEALKYVQGDWVLVLDADEVLTPEIVPQLKQAILQPGNLVVNLVRQEVGAIGSPYSLVSRLFRNHPAIRFSRPYHAMVDDSVVQLLQREPQWQVGYLPDVAIVHYGYQPEAIASKNKFQKAQAAMESYLAKHPDDAYVCSKLGALYVQVGDIDRGVELLKRGLNSKSIDDLVLYELHYHLGIAYEHLQQLNLAKYHYQAATQVPIFPKLKLAAYNNLGNVLKDNSKLQQAKTAYETALQIDPNFAPGYYNLGMTLKVLGRWEDAIAAYQKAINLNPNYAEAYQNLGVVLLKVGYVQESLSAFARAIALHEQHNPSEAQRLRQGLREMGFNF
ncbi:glycosyltransferase [Aerosakkonema sp. BLCC-F183]|uniref:glycosyltransferase n=1 Tax=Aerosakkonema sp. BLCC-F183 TaxID=3342834 RepID=UPI0035B83332